MAAHPPWPYRALDVDELADMGWRATPFQEFVFKVHQQCNLACDYCYVYELADSSWRHRPAVMSESVWRTAAARILEHVRSHGLVEIGIVLHGGEPLLAGRHRLAALVQHLRGTFAGECWLRIGVQSNGTLLDRAMLDVLADLGVRIGISIDGTAADHDRHRSNRRGQGSHDAVQAALALLTDPRYRSSYAGLLCVVDPDTDPVAVYESLLTYAPPMIDFLLPHANWSDPPRRPPGAATPYGDWLCAAFDRWYDAPHRETDVRLFGELLSLVLGGASRSEQIGLSPSGVVVVESDGAIEQVDSLKSAYDGACDTGLHIDGNPFDDALTHPGIVARQIGASALSETCLACPIHKTCGGGHYAHRYRAPDGFRNPSVYCRDLKVLIRHVTGRVAADLAHIGAGGQ